MWLHKIVAVTLCGGLTYLAASPCRAFSPADSDPSTLKSQSQELQSFLDGQSETDRRRMLDKQQRTFQLEIDGRYAKALKAYCDTGFGDERCVHPEPIKPYQAVVPLPGPGGAAALANVPPPPTAQKVLGVPVEVREMPTIAQISGLGDELTAILVLPGGKRLRVLGPGPDGPRSLLPGGDTVISIRPGEVLVNRPGEGKPASLLFQASTPSSGNPD